MKTTELYENLIKLFEEYDETIYKLTHDPSMTREVFDDTVNKMNDLAMKDIRHQLMEAMATK